MNKKEKIDFAVNNNPNFDKDTPQVFIEEYRREVEQFTDEELDEEVEWIDYLLDK